jgi:hypothetical protein
MAPASDVAASAWWTVALALTVRGGSLGALGAGAAVSAAVLSRPNLAPIAVMLGGFWIWRTVRGAGEGRPVILPLALFAGAAVPGCLAVAAINQYLAGIAVPFRLRARRGAVSTGERRSELDRYPRWLVQTQTLFIRRRWRHCSFARGRRQISGLFALIASWLLSVAAVVWLSYLYIPFGRTSDLPLPLPAYRRCSCSVAVTIEVLPRDCPRPCARAAAALIVCPRWPAG